MGHHGHVPSEVTRHWDHHHDHFFDHHRFHFFNNNWIVVDSGFGYPFYGSGYYGYPYDYGYPTGYYGSPYGYGYSYDAGSPYSYYDSGPQYYYPDQAAPPPDRTAPAPDTAAPDNAPAPAPDELTLDVQRALTKKGYDPGQADGFIGPRTTEAITEFQRDHGLKQTGRIDSSLLQALDLD
jgi:hypothetical protein